MADTKIACRKVSDLAPTLEAMAFPLSFAPADVHPDGGSPGAGVSRWRGGQAKVRCARHRCSCRRSAAAIPSLTDAHGCCEGSDAAGDYDPEVLVEHCVKGGSAEKRCGVLGEGAHKLPLECTPAHLQRAAPTLPGRAADDVAIWERVSARKLLGSQAPGLEASSKAHKPASSLALSRSSASGSPPAAGPRGWPRARPPRPRSGRPRCSGSP